MIVEAIGLLREDCPNHLNRRSPRVSVIMPVHNAEPYLGRACDSALVQTMSDLEVVIVDDGSTDGTAAIAERLASVDARVRLLRNERNRGEPYSRMRAHATALGEWLAPLDGDDAWLPERLERLLSSPGADEADAISDDVLPVEAGGTAWRCLHHRWQRPLVLAKPRWLDTCDFLRHHLGVLQPLMRRKFLEAHRLGIPDAPVANDLYLYLEMMLRGARWLQVPGAYYLNYATAGSVTSSWSQHGDTLLSNHARYANCSAVQARPALRSEFEQFLMDERVSLLIEQLRVDLRQHALRPATARLLAQPELFHRLVSQAIRRWLIKRKRDRACFELN